MSNILVTNKIAKYIKRSKIISTLKLGKPSDNPARYRPIPLLSACYMLLESLLLLRIVSLIDRHLPVKQVGLRMDTGCEELVLNLTTHIW